MPNSTTTRRSVAAAVRAAAKRAERARLDDGAATKPRPDPGPDARPDRRVVSGPGPEPEPRAAPASVKPGPEATGRRLPRRGAVTAALALVVVAGLVAIGVLGWRYQDGRRTAQARTQAVAAARKAAPVVLSYDYRHLDRDFARARGYLTGAFRKQYQKTTATVVAQTAAKYHGVVKATLGAPSGGVATTVSVVSASPDKVVVLLFVNQVTTSTQVSGSRLDLNRVRMTLTRTSGGWKVSAVDAL